MKPSETMTPTAKHTPSIDDELDAARRKRLLIAAAPALLAAAEAALGKLTFVLESNCQCKSGGVQPGTCTLCFIRSAIAMAKGEA